MILIVDNYDSFTYNLVQRLGEIDRSLQIEVFRNDKITPAEIAERRPSHLILSPGPCTPSEAGISLQCVRDLAGRMPVLGVCLGHQAIAQALGCRIVRAARPMHGKVGTIHHDQSGVFRELPNPLAATRYHSLIIDPQSLTDPLRVTAWSEGPHGQREIMGIQHRQWPMFGIQFHPESFLTDCGIQLLRNFLDIPSE